MSCTCSHVFFHLFCGALSCVKLFQFICIFFSFFLLFSSLGQFIIMVYSLRLVQFGLFLFVVLYFDLFRLFAVRFLSRILCHWSVYQSYQWSSIRNFIPRCTSSVMLLLSKSTLQSVAMLRSFLISSLRLVRTNRKLVPSELMFCLLHHALKL